MAITPPEFMRRLYSQIEKRKGMRLSAEELDLLVEMGAVDTMSSFTADWVKRQVEERRKASSDEAVFDPTVRAGRGGLSNETGAEALRRARSRSSPRARGK